MDAADLMRSTCSLCHTEQELVLSHIIPKFVYRWFKRTSPGAMRMGTNPNVRVQDGLKEYLLCRKCEQRLGDWENRFYETVFLPIHDNPEQLVAIPYQQWALKFAVSVSWRVLLYYSRQNHLYRLTKQQFSNAMEALEVWREFILNMRPHPDRFEQHIVPVSLIESHTIPDLSPQINRYLVRTIDMDVPSTSRRALVYTKMCKLMLFGVINEPHPKHWGGTKLHVRKGTLGSKTYTLPGAIMEYINYRSKKAAKILASMSPNQAAKVRELFDTKPDLVANSEVFRATDRDFALFGHAAFEHPEAEDNDS